MFIQKVKLLRLLDALTPHKTTMTRLIIWEFSNLHCIFGDLRLNIFTNLTIWQYRIINWTFINLFIL